MSRSGTVGWIGLAAYVVVWDLVMEDALSAAFARGLKHPIRRWPVTLAWGLTTLHLFGGFPERCDPFARVGRAVRGRHYPQIVVTSQ